MSYWSRFFSLSISTSGFICRNKDQIKAKKCSDYRVRFSCHPPFCGGGGISAFCVCNIKLLMQTVFLPIFFFFFFAHGRQSFKMVLWFCSFLTAMLSLFHCSLWCAGAAGLIGIILTEQETRRFWSELKKNTKNLWQPSVNWSCYRWHSDPSHLHMGGGAPLRVSCLLRKQ